MNDTYTFHLTGAVGTDITYASVAAHLRKALVADQDAHFTIDSNGGDCAEALAINAALRSFENGVTCEIRRAASAGAIVALGADGRTMAANAWILIHGVHAVIAGNVHTVRAEAARLESLDDAIADCIASAGISVEQARALVGRESWVDAGTAHELGLIDDITEALDPPPDGPSPRPPSAESIFRLVLGERTPEAQVSNAQAFVVALVSVPALAPLVQTPIAQTFPELEGRIEVSRRRDQAIALEAERLRTTTAAYRAGPATWRCETCGASNTHSPGEGLTPTPCNRCRATGTNTEA